VQIPGEESENGGGSVREVLLFELDIGIPPV